VSFSLVISSLILGPGKVSLFPIEVHIDDPTVAVSLSHVGNQRPSFGLSSTADVPLSLPLWYDRLSFKHQSLSLQIMILFQKCRCPK
jgi:hypothetical protein